MSLARELPVRPRSVTRSVAPAALASWITASDAVPSGWNTMGDDQPPAGAESETPRPPVSTGASLLEFEVVSRTPA